MLAINKLEQSLQEHSEKINKLQDCFQGILDHPKHSISSINYIEVFTILIGIIISQVILLYFS